MQKANEGLVYWYMYEWLTLMDLKKKKSNINLLDLNSKLDIQCQMKNIWFLAQLMGTFEENQYWTWIKI